VSLRLAALLTALGAAVALLARRLLRNAPIARVLAKPTDDTATDARGAVRSMQSAELAIPAAELDRIWNPPHLERLARTYWRYLERITLGLMRVVYTPTTRAVVLLASPLRLLRFEAPEYAMDQRRGIVRWRIRDGLLVAPRGRGQGYLQIDVRRLGPLDGQPGCERLRVEVEVAAFYPAIAFRLSRWLYEQTQSRVHVIVTQGFLRSLQALDLAESVVGRFAGIDEVPDPPANGGTPAPGEPISRTARP